MTDHGIVADSDFSYPGFLVAAPLNIAVNIPVNIPGQDGE